jgi:hypothetical protein
MAIPGNVGGKKTTTSISSGAADANRRLAAERQQTREKFFDNRQDVSANRLDRRLRQTQELEKFKREETKPVYTTSGSIVKGLTQRRTPESMDLTQKQMQLANKYGPTLSEIGGDFMYGLGQFTSALGDRLQQGNIGLLGIVKNVGNYLFNKTNEDYDKLNDVEKEVFENPNKYPYASKMPRVGALDSTRQLMLEAERDALGLELDALMEEREFRYNNPTVDMRKPTTEELDPMDIGYVESGQFKSDLEKSGILSVDDPSTQEPLADSTKIPGTDTTLGDLKEELKKRNYNDFQITGIINEMTQRIISGEDVNAPIENIGEPEKSEDQVSFTPYDNPFNLEFRGQEGAEPGYGGPEGNRFAKFADLDTGIKAGIDRVAEIVGQGKSTDEFLNIYAPRSDNQESYDNYLATLQEKVGPTIEPDEIKPLTEGIVRFENKPELADQYLNYLEQEKDKLYSGIVS